MASLVRFPKVSENIIEGTVGAWRRREGEIVRAGEPLVEMITSKATFEVECPSDGVLLRVLAPPKSNVPVNYVLAVVGAHGEAIPNVAEENERLFSLFRQGAQAAAGPSFSAGAKVRATPGARRLAKEAGVDLAAMPVPAGQDVLREEDVRRFLEKSRGN